MRCEINNIKLYFACWSVIIVVHMNMNPEPKFEFDLKVAEKKQTKNENRKKKWEYCSWAQTSPRPSDPALSHTRVGYSRPNSASPVIPGWRDRTTASVHWCSPAVWSPLARVFFQPNQGRPATLLTRKSRNNLNRLRSDPEIPARP